MSKIVTFAQNQRIRTRDGIMEDFNPYPYQKRTLNEFHNNQYNIVWKVRQVGISTLSVIYSFYHALEEDNNNILFISPTMHSSSDHLRTLRMIMNSNKNYDWEEKVNKENIHFKNGSKFMCKPADRIQYSGLNMYKPTLIIIDEAAYISDLERIYKQIYHLNSDYKTKVIISSTDNKSDNTFINIYKDALRLKNDYRPIMLDNDVCEDRDVIWKANQKTLLGKEHYKQEYETF